ncbi:MAG: hypothetical protein U1F77_06805, partial [Kiritimatiellia bacterium]
PVVIVDEAHNARTDLSFATLGAVLPSCIVEFTATPARKKHPSNVLHHVSAAELKAADMVKLPLRVVTRHPSQRDALIAEAIQLRSSLEALAVAESQDTAEYLRPILLFQAERVDGCEPLRERLTSEFGIPKEQILISVGVLDELPGGEEIRSPKCPARFIITVQKLREGWDCPFAYVLCSLKETRSSTAIEQIVGRILRLPSARSKRHPDLNCSYVFSVSESVPDVLAELREALENNGFTAREVDRILMPVSGGILPLGVQPRTVKINTDWIDPVAAMAQNVALEGKAKIDASTGSITITVPLSKADEEAVVGCLRNAGAQKDVAEAIELVRVAEKAFGGTGQPRMPTPYERQLDFFVPLLSVVERDQLIEFESTFLLEHPWKLSAKDATLPLDYDPTRRPAGRSATIDVNVRGAVETSLMAENEGFDFVGKLHQSVLALGVTTEWTLEALVGWLDKHIDHQDIPLGESAEFLRRVVRGLMARHSIENVSVLALDRYRLRDCVSQDSRAPSIGAQSSISGLCCPTRPWRLRLGAGSTSAKRTTSRAGPTRVAISSRSTTSVPNRASYSRRLRPVVTPRNSNAPCSWTVCRA